MFIAIPINERGTQFMSWKSAYERFQRAVNCGYAFQFNGNSNYYSQLHRYHDSYYVKKPNYNPPYTAKNGSHDDGPLNGPFLGGIGTSNYSRDFTGMFSRWQLQQGIHHHEAIEPAFFMLRWKIADKIFYKRIRIGDNNFHEGDMKYAALFPFVYEFYDSSDLPFQLLMEYYSPVIPHNYQDSSLPITSFNFYLKSKINEEIEVSVGLSWPNLLGWRLPFISSDVRQEMQWPTQQYAGNSGEIGAHSINECHVVQYKSTPVKQKSDMQGNIVISLKVDDHWNTSCKPCFRANQIATGEADVDQKYTIAHMEEQFKTLGKLDNDYTHWEAHWHEPVASAIAANAILHPQQESQLLFNITMDLPVTSFGAGRNWYKAYTEKYGTECKRSLQLAQHGLKSNASWLEEISSWHERELDASGQVPSKVKGAQINELQFVVAGGSVWVTKPVEEHEEETPKLPKSSHYGLLEGFDTGYYYYNTLDLWVYAFPALSKNWPKLAESVFIDFLHTAPLVDDRKHMVYRTATIEKNLVYGKLPHDMGSAPEDPWVQLNGYVHRDNPNLWKDHNPSFILAYYLHRKISGNQINQDEYETLMKIAKFTEDQDTEDIGVPKHDEFGDSTWDNLDMNGLSTYASSLCIGAWAVMAKLSEVHNREMGSYYKVKLAKAQKTIETLWNGKYYKTNDLGKYSEATMTDSLFGVYMAKKAGLGDLLPIEKVQSHLKSIYENNLMAYAEGKYGPLLVAEPDRQHYDQDGGEELQVNEVIVGSAWMFAAMLYEYNLIQEADYLANNLRDMIYKGTGLQFRTPAAWDNEGKYRAPLNMRPLAIWMI